MSGLSARFFGSALVYAILGMGLGLHMGMSHDHTQMPTHAHIMLVGWVSFAIFGFFYHLFPSAAEGWLAKVHFWLAEASFLILTTGLFLIFGGSASADPIAGVGSIGLLASMILFAIIAWPTVTGR
jgi:heme/copper-type cytochrome/quinol oxidase subunit 1